MLYTFWKGTLLSKWDEVKDEECLKYGKDLIEHSIRENIPIKKQIETYIHFLNCIKRRKDNNQPIYRSDHQMAYHSLMALCYLQIINLDDDTCGILKINQKSRKIYPSKQLNLVV